MTKYVKVSVTTQYNIMRGVKPYRDTIVVKFCRILHNMSHVCFLPFWDCTPLRDLKIRSFGSLKANVSKTAKVKVKVKERIVLREIHLRTTGRHLSNGITQCYLLPDRGGRPAFTPTTKPNRQRQVVVWLNMSKGAL